MRVCHKPRDASFRPIEVTYHWTEHRETGDVVRSHTELVRSLPHRYTINVAGRRDPTMHWVRMNLQDSKAGHPGYSDGVDVGPGWERAKVTYRWGKNLAQGKSYTASRPSSPQSGNPDSDGRELTNGVIIAPTDYVRDKTVQAATAFWEPGEPVTFVVDLENQARIAGVRVSTHQPNARFCHPATVEVAVSEDGQRWQPAGTIRHDDLWNPPGDYEPWEHDDSPAYANLPAGGRLAYSFPLVFTPPLTGRYVRFVCTPLDGKGMGISELQVFEQVAASPWPADIRLAGQGGTRNHEATATAVRPGRAERECGIRVGRTVASGPGESHDFRLLSRLAEAGGTRPRHDTRDLFCVAAGRQPPVDAKGARGGRQEERVSPRPAGNGGWRLRAARCFRQRPGSDGTEVLQAQELRLAGKYAGQKRHDLPAVRADSRAGPKQPRSCCGLTP